MRTTEVKLGSKCSVVVSIFHALSQLSKACLMLLGSHSSVYVCIRLLVCVREGGHISSATAQCF